MAVTLVLDAGGSRLKWGELLGGKPGPIHSAEWSEAETAFRAWMASRDAGARLGLGGGIAASGV